MRAETTEAEFPSPTITETEDLLKELQSRAHRRVHFERGRRTLNRISLCCFLLCSVPLMPDFRSSFPALLPYIPLMEPLREFFLLAILAGWVPEVAAWIGAYRSRNRLRSLIGELKTEVRAIGPLALLCEHQEHFPVADYAVEALLTLLPQAKAGDFRHLSDREMKALLGLLNDAGHSAWHPDRFQKSAFYRFSVSFAGNRFFDTNRVQKLPPVILLALEQAGDSRAIGAVRRLATSRPDTPYRLEAQECLIILKKQAESRDNQRFLLMPSSQTQPQENLLRPIVPQAETQPELLLRAATEQKHP